MNRFTLLPLFSFVALALASCGGKIEEGSIDPTSSGGTPSPTTTTTSVPPSPGTPGSPGSSGSSGTAPTPTPTTPSSKTLTAQALPGGLDHIMIFAADAAADSCVRIHMTRPFGTKPGNPYSIATPDQWGVQDISRAPGAKRCGPGKQPPAAEQSNGAKGTITWGPPATKTVYPCSINVHVAAAFKDAPTLEQIDGDKIVLEDGCQ